MDTALPLQLSHLSSTRTHELIINFLSFLQGSLVMLKHY